MRRTYLWFFQLVTGALIAVLLGIHIVVQHFDAILVFFGVDAAQSTSWAAMTARASQGIWVFIYIALLAVGLYHGINGLRNIILEVTRSTRAERAVTWAMIVIGIIFFAGGTYVPVALLTG